jgi:hypothetical protein
MVPDAMMLVCPHCRRSYSTNPLLTGPYHRDLSDNEDELCIDVQCGLCSRSLIPHIVHRGCAYLSARHRRGADPAS